MKENQQDLPGNFYGPEMRLQPLNPADPVGEIMRRLDLVTNLFSALIAINKGADNLGAAETLQALTEQGDYFRAAAAFMRAYQQQLRAVFSESPAGYEVKTRALNDAINSLAGGLHKFPADILGPAIFEKFKALLAEYSAAGTLPVKEETPAPPVDDATAVKSAASDFARDALRLNDAPRAPRFDLLKVIAAPSSPAGQIILDVAARAEGGAESLKELEKRKSTHGAEWVVSTEDARAIVTRKNPRGEEIKLGIFDISKFKRRRAGTSKKFAKLLLSKAGYEFDGAALSSHIIALNAAELVGLGMYTRKEDARAGILTAVDAFKYFGMWGKVLNAEGRLRDIWLPFITMSDSAFDGDDLLIKLNPDIKWADICAQFSYLPALYFRLPARAADLLEKIYTIARMRGSWLYQHVAFYVDLVTVAEWLRLPPVAGCKYAKKYIKGPIFKAVSAINKAGGGEALSLVAAADDTPLNPDLPVGEWIAGRLRIDVRKTPAWRSISEIFAENRRKAGAAARQKIAVDTALAVDAARAEKRKTDKKENPAQNDLAAKYNAAFGKGVKK